MARGRKRAEKKTATKDVIDSRSRKAARKLMYNKLTKGKEISPGQKKEIEARLDQQLGSQASVPDAGGKPWEGEVYPQWVVGQALAVDDKVASYGQDYIVIQAHTTEATWPPATTPALFSVIVQLPPGEYPDWVQPTGAHDAYNIGDIVNHDNALWQSDVDSNTWEPGVYGWTIYVEVPEVP